MTHDSNLCAEATIGMAGSPLWYANPAKSLELSHLTGASDIQSNEGLVFCPPKTINPSSMTRPSEVWQSMSLVNASLSLFRESTKDKRNVLMRSILSDYQSPLSSKASSCVNQVEVSNKIESASPPSACRLFGFDLRTNSQNIIPTIKDSSMSLNCDNDSKSHLKITEADDTQSIDPLNSSKETEIVPVSPSEGKQLPILPSRTRIKVSSIVHSLK